MDLPDATQQEEAEGQAESQEGEALQRVAAPSHAPQNRTGLPDGLKAGVESLSGLSLDDVRVHYHSTKPAQVDALAYTQGSEIHVGPGQERHLPHEAWHVVQQKQGRVQPTLQMKGVAINDDQGLEREADVMGGKVANSRLIISMQAEEAPTHGAHQEINSTNLPIQRTIENEYYKEDVDADNIARAKAFFNSYNDKVQEAYNYAITRPSLGVYVNLNNHTRSWVQKWQEYLAGNKPKLMAATFGYVIETLVSTPGSIYSPNPPPGCGVTCQETRGGTRPDLILKLRDGSQEIAWLDLTASGSTDHIYSKEGWGSKISIFAEVTYPSLTLATMAFMTVMARNEGNTENIDQEELKRILDEEREKHELRQVYWKELGKQYNFSSCKAEVRKELGLNNELLGIFPDLKREFIRKKLQKDFGPDMLDGKMVPSILAAMEVASGPWGYETGYNESRSAGERWLIDNAVEEPTAMDIGE
jgi:hypothetical protein